MTLISKLPNDFTIGYYLSKSKLERLKWDQFVELCKTKYNIKCIPIDMEVTEYTSDKCPYDIIVDKLTDELSNQMKESNKKTISQIKKLLERYPNLIQVDALESQIPVLDRVTLSVLLEKLNDLPSHLNVKSPNFVVIEKKLDNYTSLLESRSIRFPIVVKPIQACGSEESHLMSILFKEEDLHSIESQFPVLVQEYINHNAIIYKAFVIGNYTSVVYRKSLKNLSTDEKSPIYFDSQKPLPPTLLDQQDVDTSLVELPTLETLSAISKDLQKHLSLTLFGFDVIIDCVSKKLSIVDVNYFPTYGGIKDFFSILLDHIINVYLEKSKEQK
ncbi:inositol 1 [Tieghemostelium lacteum]|uniref:Inositol-tetrakisphosphate 1-kinase n=1 Tax=Tieghemostelium lacteum TaxID=361077 RepID=A0A151ZC07_TIELA|nr:inositol 1 [Tieghemostelium lacteum]|eukprot:KYQ91455.1 inositol 1 [Tieghemostelium lacteum]